MAAVGLIAITAVTSANGSARAVYRPRAAKGSASHRVAANVSNASIKRLNSLAHAEAASVATKLIALAETKAPHRVVEMLGTGIADLDEVSIGIVPAVPDLSHGSESYEFYAKIPAPAGHGPKRSDITKLDPNRVQSVILADDDVSLLLARGLPHHRSDDWTFSAAYRRAPGSNSFANVFAGTDLNRAIHERQLSGADITAIGPQFADLFALGASDSPEEIGKPAF